jgi:signal transduction histidine kinase/ligand-binding sensor domain-containing protein
MQTKEAAKAFSFAFCLFLCTTAFGQTIIPRFESLGVNDGLPHSSVYSIIQDKKGFMWFGTADGLCRYDGNKLVPYKYSAKTPGDIVNNFVRGKMLPDTSGNIWYSNESGIFKWDAQQEQVLKIKEFTKNEFGNVAFKAVALDADGSLWLLNHERGMFNFNIFSGNIKQYPFPVTVDHSNALFVYSTNDNAGNIWLRIVSNTDPYVVFNTTTHKYSIRLAKDPPHAIFFGNDNAVYAYDDRLVYKEGENQTKTIYKSVNNKPLSFYSFEGIRDSHGRLWMTARGNGLFYYDEKNRRFMQYHHDNSRIKSLPFDLTTCLFIDRGDNLWIGIDGGGVARLDLKEPKFNLFPLSAGDYPILKDYFTKCFYEDEKGRTWFGTHTNGLNILDHKTNILTSYLYDKSKLSSLPGNIVGSIFKDREGNTWIGSSGGISIFDETKASFSTIPISGLPRLQPERNAFVSRIIQLKNGDLLAATMLGIIKIIKQGNKYHGCYFTSNSFLISNTTDVVEMEDGTVYATVTGFGLYQLKPKGIEYTLERIFLAGIDLRSLRKDDHDPGWLWLSTGIGLVHFNTSSKEHILWDEKNGMANSYVYGSLEDTAGNLWISTNGGLSFFNRNAESFTNYTYQDGLQSNEFNTQAFYKSHSGVFYFGGIKGFNWFSPARPPDKRTLRPEAAITGFEINDSVFRKDRNYKENATVSVPYFRNDFNFHFAVLDYTRPEANKVQYMLEGWDGDWVVSDNNSARYANLPPGTYRLRVKAANADGVWSEEERISLIIEAPFWKQKWFYSATLILLLISLVALTYHFSQLSAKRKWRALEKQIAVNAERNRISADMHDEIGSGITHIALLSELIQTQQKGEAEMKKDVKIISVSARKLVQTMSDIIWALNPQNDTLDSLLAYIREQSQQYFDPFNINFTISFPADVLVLKLTNVQRRNLYLVTQELLSNAMKHSCATAIQLGLTVTSKEFCFTVEDNGVGIAGRQATLGSNGLKNLKKRMLDIEGTIEWLPANPGTLVKYCLPIRPTT